jgi:hypothetical protein
MPDSECSFWKDEAKLACLTEEARVKVWIGILTGLLIAGSAGFSGSSFGFTNLQSWLTSIAVALILFPASIAIEMFNKGRTAGNGLKSRLDEANSERDAIAHRFDDDRYKFVAEIFEKLPVEGRQWLRDLLVRTLVPVPTDPHGHTFSEQSHAWGLRDNGIVVLESGGGLYALVPTYRPIIQRLVQEAGL